MGGLFSSGEKTTTQTQESSPWEPQQEYLKGGFSAARDAFQKAKQFQGDTYADLTAEQQAGLDKLVQNSNVTSQAAGQVGDAVGGSFGQLYGDFIGQTQGVLGSAGQDRTDQIVNNAEAFMNNDVVQGQIDSALGDVSRAFDQQRGDINAAASGSGNINSTRAAALEARAQDNAMDRAADISSSMRSNAYNTGLGLANQNARNSFQEELQATDAASNAAGQGLGYLEAANSLNGQAAQDLLEAGSFRQAQNQGEMDANMSQSERDLRLVQEYIKSISGNYGGTTTGTQTQPTASPFQQILGGGIAAAGALGGGSGISSMIGGFGGGR